MRLTLLLTGLISQMSYATSISDSLEQNFLAKGGPQKAVAHLRCALDTWAGRDIRLKVSATEAKCAEPASRVRFQDTGYAVVVDYTQTSNKRRFFMLDLRTGQVDALYVSHGRFNTDRHNTTPGPNKNTILKASYFSNRGGSNASATRLFVTSKRYLGTYRGTSSKDPKYSLVLQGLESGINENSCNRLMVIHGKEEIQESGSSRGVNIMSSGCFMLDYDVVNDVVNATRASGGSGTALFAYGPREAALPSNYYCRNGVL